MAETFDMTDFSPEGLTTDELDRIMRYARTTEPVFYWPRLDAWVVTRYEDVLSVLHKPDPFSSQGVYDTVPWAQETKDFFEQAGRNPLGAQTFIIDMDPPRHTEMRRQINKVFTPRRIAEREPDVIRFATQCVDSFPSGEPFSFVELLAAPLQMLVIFSMLNISTDDVPKLARWSADIKKLISTAMPVDEQLACAASTLAMDTYAGDLIASRRAHPTDDFFSDLVHEAAEGSLTWTDRELRALISPGLILAGFTTTKSTLTTAVYNILNEPGVWADLCASPDKIGPAIEESMRHSPPMFGFFRNTTRAVEVSGTTIPAGAHVVWATFSANRDEAKCPHADRFDISRPSTEQSHLSFGHGPHVCLGAGLARLTMRQSIRIMCERHPSLRIAPDFQPRYSSALVARELEDLVLIT